MVVRARTTRVSTYKLQLQGFQMCSDPDDYIWTLECTVTIYSYMYLAMMDKCPPKCTRINLRTSKTPKIFWSLFIIVLNLQQDFSHLYTIVNLYMYLAMMDKCPKMHQNQSQNV